MARRLVHAGCRLTHGSGHLVPAECPPGRPADDRPLTCWRAQRVLAYGADVSGFDATPQTPVRGLWKMSHPCDTTVPVFDRTCVRSNTRAYSEGDRDDCNPRRRAGTQSPFGKPGSIWERVTRAHWGAGPLPSSQPEGAAGRHVEFVSTCQGRDLAESPEDRPEPTVGRRPQPPGGYSREPSVGRPREPSGGDPREICVGRPREPGRCDP